ncbi:hypothetical protein BVC80_8591g4 [Macleaya cordata]|uniref:Uncharacterized protein n=1 Tax=Macleaya cordata TaxID=56857 RepID=A0A200PP84_MACCD|nr:hypothetical protein BVC80_8591g4 [Macleaya cordata]
MKTKGFDPFETKEERLSNRPRGAASKRNKENKSKQTLHHRAGSKSFIRCSVETSNRTYTDPKAPLEGKEAEKIRGESSSSIARKNAEEVVTLRQQVGTLQKTVEYMDLMLKKLEEERLERIRRDNTNQDSEETPSESFEDGSREKIDDCTMVYKVVGGLDEEDDGAADDDYIEFEDEDINKT